MPTIKRNRIQLHSLFPSRHSLIDLHEETKFLHVFWSNTGDLLLQVMEPVEDKPRPLPYRKFVAFEHAGIGFHELPGDLEFIGVAEPNKYSPTRMTVLVSSKFYDRNGNEMVVARNVNTVPAVLGCAHKDCAFCPVPGAEGCLSHKITQETRLMVNRQTGPEPCSRPFCFGQNGDHPCSGPCNHAITQYDISRML